jgi:transcriptional regulator with XRE-family HTH domain
MTKAHRRPEELAEVSKRLVLLRKAMVGVDHGAQARFARMMDIRQSAWSNYELGIRMICHEHAVRLCNRTGVTFDWNFRGQFVTSMPQDLLHKITEAASITAAGRKRA